MSIAIVQNHTMKSARVEPREREFARMLRALGNDVAIYGLAENVEFTGSDSTRFFVPDDASVASSDRASLAMVRQILDDAPDIILFKGLGYRTVDLVLDACAHKAMFGAILGGKWSSSTLRRMNYVFAEYAAQIDLIKKAFGCEDAVFTEMPKLLPWDAIERAADTAKIFDACCVSAFIPRKNHVALQALFGKCRIVLVGEGTERSSITQMAQAEGGGDLTTFTGAVAHAETMRIMQSARLLVHPSNWEGLPRAVIEGFACGLPVVGLEATLGPALGHLPFVRLCRDASEIAPSVLELLGDERTLNDLSDQARQYARKRHSQSTLQDVAEKFSNMIGDKAGASRTVLYKGFTFDVSHPGITTPVIESMEKGRYEKAEGTIVKARLVPGDRVLEMGTGMGYVSMQAASIVGPENVFTFEASPITYSISKRNFKLNGLAIYSRNEFVVPRARQKEYGNSVDFFVSESVMSSSMLPKKHRQKIVVSTTVAEDVIESKGINVIVMDVEGYEESFLKDVDLSMINKIICECHYRKVGKRSINEMIKSLYQRDFFIDLSVSTGEVLFLHRGAAGVGP